MPITCKTYTTSAQIVYPDGDQPEYHWYGELKLTVNNLVLSDKECQDLMGKVTGIFIAHSDKLKNIDFSISDSKWKTQHESDHDKIDDLRVKIKNFDPEEDDTEQLEKDNERLAKLLEEHPDKVLPEVDADYEGMVADIGLKPDIPVDLKCEDEDA